MEYYAEPTMEKVTDHRLVPLDMKQCLKPKHQRVLGTYVLVSKLLILGARICGLSVLRLSV